MRNKSQNKIIYVDPGKCLGCHSCEFSCALAHSSAKSLFDVEALKGAVSRTHVVKVGDSNVPMQCRHCEDAPCTKVCPTGSLRQATGLGSVSITEQSCIGCKLCTMVCPFGVISVEKKPDSDSSSATNNGVAMKCDLCNDWRKEKGETQTACEQACPTQAIKLVDLYEYRTARSKARAAEIANAHKSIFFTF
ncbi:4Fe-4S dicluster domain-containing protein [Pseudovibrio sp. Tun.PSC04-5.I4]|uniref:4Fe-4S dicluster domain-containing protein n=1 Tax=Pseudovibrio sp. Tun.PSC04-5.I4 TaxID=1798213 RepID=UPI000890977A|nr:4Fe-4S dicluster domain-containing protein [Pseudovibrio sp. Tun.PSC04-5.I4]SDQ12354.1 carbon-monoxide dehydrogenase iron sulfur subunit [Pseudovibrio sp. Tun.PSC04-5.I4]